jgi:hypothetical protein
MRPTERETERQTDRQRQRDSWTIGRRVKKAKKIFSTFLLVVQSQHIDDMILR